MDCHPERECAALVLTSRSRATGQRPCGEGLCRLYIYICLTDYQLTR